MLPGEAIAFGGRVLNAESQWLAGHPLSDGRVFHGWVVTLTLDEARWSRAEETPFSNPMAAMQEELTALYKAAWRALCVEALSQKGALLSMSRLAQLTAAAARWNAAWQAHQRAVWIAELQWNYAPQKVDR